MDRFFRGVGVVALCAWTVGCGAAADPMAPNNSSVMALSRDGGALWVADGDNGVLTRIDVATGEMDEVEVGKNPTRVARIGDRLLVTLRGERSIAELRDGEDGYELLRKVKVGAEPFGIVATADGRRVYVALAMQDEVVELDGDTLEPIRSFAVDGEPRWLAINEPANLLYVGTRTGEEFTTVALGSGRVTSARFPRVERGVVTDGDEQLLVMTPRITGDPTLSPDGSHLAVPVVYVDHYSTVGSADGTGPTLTGSDGSQLPVSNPGYYATGPRYGLTRFNPAVVIYPVGIGGQPKEAGAHAMLVVGESDLAGNFSLDDARGDMVSVTASGGQFDTGLAAFAGTFTVVRSYLSSLRFSADGNLVYGTLEGSETLVAIPREPVAAGFPGFTFGADDPYFGVSSFETAPGMYVAVGAGPAGIALDGDGQLYTYAFLDRTVSKVPVSVMERGVEVQVLGDTFGMIPSFKLEPSHRLPESVLPVEEQVGRRLFYSASNPEMSSEGAGVSCATCHVDGRDDGLTWHFPAGPRQTPLLAGSVAHTAPYTWAEEVPTLEDEVMLTSQGRMLGNGISSYESSAIATYLGALGGPDTPRKGATDAAAERGRALFERADVGCSTCHTGEQLTDNAAYEMYGMKAVNTPSLVGVAASAPYLHDGSAKTLADVIAGADKGGMGRTRHLSAAELIDLEAYLSTL
jgi:DNA-binding beta-propeller fold protein YncE/mono/diheme cytochrome c family protein